MSSLGGIGGPASWNRPHEELDLLALFAKVSNNGGKSVFFDRSHCSSAKPEGNESLLFSKPNALALEIRQETARRLSRYLDADTPFLLCDTTRNVRESSRRTLSSNLTHFRHISTIHQITLKVFLVPKIAVQGAFEQGRFYR